MFHLFKLKSTLGRSTNAGFADVRRTKKALRKLGYYETPDYGLTDYPDKRLFKGIEKFQSDNGLKKDGLMKPDGPTASTLGERLARQAPRPTLREQMQNIKKRGARKSLLDSDEDDGTPNDPPDNDEPENPDEEPDEPREPKEPKPSCTSEWLALRKVTEKMGVVESGIVNLEMKINNLKLEIEKGNPYGRDAKVTLNCW